MKNSKNLISKNLFYCLFVFSLLLPSNFIYPQFESCNSENECSSLTLEAIPKSVGSWDKSVLKYYFENGTEDITGDDEKSAFYTAFDTWAAVVPIKFEEVFSKSSADIKIYYADEEAWESMDVSSSHYAAAYKPGQNCAGYIVMNDWNWTFSLSTSEDKDLVYIAIHEVGHVLGLCHSNADYTMMYFSYSPQRNLHTYDIQAIQEIYPSIPITVENNFDGGSVYVNNLSTAKTAPYDFVVETGDEVEVSLGAMEQNDGTYDRIWNDTEAPSNLSEWERISSGGSSVSKSSYQNYTFNASSDDINSTYEAGLRKVLNITLQNSYDGGVITVNGTETNSPYTDQNFIEANELSFSVPLNTTINYIDFKFQEWSDGSSTYEETSQTFYPTDHKTYTANYIGTVNNSYRNMRDTGILWDFIVIEWDEHPDTDVTHYKVYRRVKHNGVMGDEVLVATKPRGSTSYTDSYYVKAKTYVDLVQYDVRGYYSPDGTYPDADYFAVYGEPCLPKENDTTAVENEIVNGFALANYPNPFNPSTNINFSIPKAQNVKLLIYNLLGEKVKELVNSNMEAGSYTVQWNGDNQSGRKVNSGVYFSVLQTQEKRIVKKMILSK